MSNRTFAILFSVLAVIFVAAAGTGIWLVTQSKQGGTALVGGPFELTDHTGTAVTDETYDGSYKIVYFGYTFCPDICPTGLTTISGALDILGDEAAAKIKPLFITIDPERDTVDALSVYHQHFHPSFSNLTGTPEQIAAVAKAYRVFYQRAESEGASEYLMDHSTVTYLMGPDGGYVNHFPHGITPEQLADALRNVL